MIQLVVIQNVSTNLCSRGTEIIFEIWQILFLSFSQSIISGFVLNAGVMYNQLRDDAKIKKSLFKSHTVFTPEKSCGILLKNLGQNLQRLLVKNSHNQSWLFDEISQKIPKKILNTWDKNPEIIKKYRIPGI